MVGMVDASSMIMMLPFPFLFFFRAGEDFDTGFVLRTYLYLLSMLCCGSSYVC